jgi:hypothetical protein
MVKTIDFTRATEFIWKTARLLDRQRFAFLFLHGSRDAVLEALRPYQNPDGGFGNGLEPDVRAPLSQPLPTWTALCTLDELSAFDDPMVGRACDYLLSITTEEGGVPFTLPSVMAYPHAPWWAVEGQQPASLNPTAAIAALLHKHGFEHPWLAPASAYCWRQLANLDQTSAYEMRAVLPFLDWAPERARAEEVFAQVGPKIVQQKLVALAPTEQEETHTPLNFAPRPQSLARRLFSDAVIETHLEALANAQQADGGWKFNWLDWNPTTTLEWRGIVTIEALLTLRAYGLQG